MSKLHSMGDQALIEKTRRLVKEEREITTRVLHHLREVERRRLFSDLGYPSLFAYVMGDLHYSEASAHRRIAAMRLLKELPEIEQKIESGELSLSVISQAQTFFRQEAKLEKPLDLEEKKNLLAALEGKSSRETERELLSRSSDPVSLRPERVRLVGETHSELKFLVTQETMEQLERIRGLLGHTHSQLSMSELIAAMAKITLEKLDPAREAKRAKKPVAAEVKLGEVLASAQSEQVVFPPPEVRETRKYIRAALRREVWKQAQGKCQNCGSLYRLQIDHIEPVARGGTNDSKNLRLLCFHCNQRQADLTLGRERMETHRTSSAFAEKTAATTRPTVAIEM